MTKLAALRTQLNAVSRQRRNARWGVGYTALALAALWALAALFLVDFEFDLPPAARAVALVAWLATVVVVFRHWTLPWLRRRESELDIALLVEKRQHIDSDLVAALEFEWPGAQRWGSPQLEAAVIDYVADYGAELQLDDVEYRRPLRWRTRALLATLVVLGLAAAIYHDHVRVFFNRLALGSLHYPVSTRIDVVTINSQPIDLTRTDGPAWGSPFGQPLHFEVRADGNVPDFGRVELITNGERLMTSVELVPDGSQRGLYRGTLERLVDSVTWQVFLGDAWTDPRELVAMPLPVITIGLLPTPPKYAAQPDAALDSQSGTRQISVVEGTRVDVQLECTNKRLQKAVLTVADQSFAFASEDDGRRRWRLEAADTPLERILEPLRYTVQVMDEDGLQLTEPIQGFIRIKSDRPPRVTAALVTQYVLPTGRPKLSFGAVDDYGVASLRLHRQVVREDGSTQDDTVEIPFEPAPQKVVQGRYTVDLEPLKLLKGDQLKLTLEAQDHRGGLAAKSALGEPLVLYVTDERGVLAAMAETDQRSARQLDIIIQRELGIGE